MALASEERDDSAGEERANDGATPKETADRRRGMGSVEGGGEGDGRPQGDLASVPGGASADAAATTKASDASDTEGNDARDDSGLKGARNLVLALKGLAGNRRALAGLGAAGGIIGLIIAAFVLYGQFKLIAMMENLDRHAHMPNQHSMKVRERVLIKNYIANHWEGTNLAADDATASFTQQVFRRLHQGGLEKRLAEQGIKITVRGDPGFPAHKIIVVNDNGTEKPYHTRNSAEFDALGRDASDLSARITATDRSFKRIVIKSKLSKLLGSSWHPLDPVRGKYSEVKTKVANGILEQFLKVPALQDVIVRAFDALLGKSDAGKKIKDQVQSDLASGQAENKVLSKVVTESISRIAAELNPWLAAAFVVDLLKRMDDTFSNGTIQKLIQKKQELEYMATFRHLASGAHEIKAGKSDWNTANAAEELLTSTDGAGKIHDISESNNFMRTNEKAVDFKPNTDCKNTVELCDHKVPSKAASSSTIGRDLNALQGAANSPIGQVLHFGLNALDIAATAINKVLGVFGEAAMGVARLVPGVSALEAGAKDLIAGLGKSLLADVLPPVVDSTTKGPALYNAAAAGASLTAAAVAGAPVGTDGGEADACYKQDVTSRGGDNSLCGHPLTKGEVAQIDIAVVQEQNEAFQRASSWSKIASLEYPNSMASRLLNTTPSTPALALQRSGQTMTAMINPRSWVWFFQNLPQWLTPKLSAATAGGSSYVVVDDASGKYAADQFGVTQYGCTESELSDQSTIDDHTDGAYHCADNVDVAAGCSLASTMLDDRNRPIDPPAACSKFDSSGGSSDAVSADNSTAPPGANGLVFPIKAPVVPASSWTLDQGVDISTTGGACGKAAPEVAIADGKIVAQGIGGFGPDAPTLHITSGSLAGRDVYYGHALGRPVSVGDTVKAGQVITYVGCGIVGMSSGPHIEIGINQPGQPLWPLPKNATSSEMLGYLKGSYKGN